MLGTNVISWFSMGFGALKRSSVCEEGWCQLVFDTLWCERQQVWSAIFILSKMHCVHGGQGNSKPMTCILLDKKNVHSGKSEKIIYIYIYRTADTAIEETVGHCSKRLDNG